LLGHADPIAGDPLLHLHDFVTLATQETPLRSYPALHDAHLAPLLVHAHPVAGDPLVHVHVFACGMHTKTFCAGLIILYPTSQDAHTFALLLGHADPVAGEPLLHVPVLACFSHGDLALSVTNLYPALQEVQ
jgi:hypothetical protein